MLLRPLSVQRFPWSASACPVPNYTWHGKTLYKGSRHSNPKGHNLCRNFVCCRPATQQGLHMLSHHAHLDAQCHEFVRYCHLHKEQCTLTTHSRLASCNRWGIVLLR